jgi:lysozyme family protein
MKANFSPSLGYVLLSEGGFVNNPADKGGPTNCGITQRVYDHWLTLHGLPTQDVRLLTDIEKAAIYSSLYWDPICGDQLPAGVDYATFDFAVNSGDRTAARELEHDINVNRAARFLQRSAAIAEDGFIGPQTLAALSEVPPPQLIDTLCDERIAFLKTLSNFPTFGKGWLNRVATVRSRAKAMAS